MASSDASTVEQYLSEMEPERSEALRTVRRAILRALPDGYDETMRWGMITYEVPLATYPDTYNGQPLMYAALADQKRHMAVYLTSLYSDPARLEQFREDYRASGKKLDIGASCVRFARLDQLPVDLIAEVIAATSVEDFVELYRASR